MVDITEREEPEIGNKECIKALEALLERARKGGLCHISFAYVEIPYEVMCGSFGSMYYIDEVHTALDQLRSKFDDAIDAQANPYDPSIGADYACFSLSRGILNFDFIVWLVGAEMRRIREGAPAPLKLAFYIHKQTVFTERQQQYCQNIVYPLAQMLAEPTDQLGGFGHFPFFYRDITEACRRGERVPHLNPNTDVMNAVARELDGAKPITITLREAEHFPHRNSNIETWLKFAEYLNRNGERVIFVRDTAKAHDSLNGWSIFPAASENLHTRMSLYRQAKMNFGVSNGPMTLNFHSDVPFAMFIELDPLHLKRYQLAWPEWWLPHTGVDATKGEQFPWFNEAQRIVWKRDDYDNLVEAYEGFKRSI